jgi:glutathione S-transferase
LGPPRIKKEALNYRYFTHYAEGSLMPPLFAQLVLGRVPLLGKIAQRRFKPMIDIHLDFVEAELAKRTWFAGEEFTAADIMMSYPLEVAEVRADGRQSRPHTSAWLDRIHARSGYQKALTAGGPYALV